MKPPKREDFFFKGAYDSAWYSYWATVISMLAVVLTSISLILALV